MKKKIIFVTEALWIGGIEISLINLLRHMDYSKYDITLLVLRNYLDLADRVPEQCRLVIADRCVQISAKQPYRFRRLFSLMEEPQHASAVRRLIWKILCILLKAPEAFLWSRYIKQEFRNEQFDTAVIYDNRTAETVVRGLCARKYIMFYHQGVMSHAYHDFLGWKHADRIIAVSEPIGEKLKAFMPAYAKKVTTIRNIIDVEAIISKSEEPIDMIFDRNVVNIVSCGRLSKEKGMHIAIEACAKLASLGYVNFRWYFIGGGREYSNLTEQIKRLELEEYAILLGEKDNPIPYLAQADLFVQTSLFESYGLSLAEAMILGLPVVSTKTDGSIALTQNGKLGILCEINSESVANEVAKLMCSKESLNALRNTEIRTLFIQQNRECVKKLTCIL